MLFSILKKPYKICREIMIDYGGERTSREAKAILDTLGGRCINIGSETRYIVVTDNDLFPLKHVTWAMGKDNYVGLLREIEYNLRLSILKIEKQIKRK